jgi:hypothetical protein
MRVCVIGTSNAIYKDGYCGAIADDPRVSYFRKYCIGASPSIIIPYFAGKIDFADFDFVVFDTAINDSNYFKYGSIRKDQIRQFVEFGIHEAVRAGCRPALLVMPSLKRFAKPTMARIIYTRIAAENSAVFLDGFTFAGQLAAETGVELGSLFLDDFHLRKDIARQVGTLLVDQMAASRHTPLPGQLAQSRFYSIELAEHFPWLERSTSLASSRLVQLQGTPMHLSVPPGHEVAGIVYNSAKTSGAIRIGSDIVKSLWTKYFNAPKNLLTIMAPVIAKNPVDASGRLAIQLASPEDAITEASRFEHFAPPPSLSAVVEVETLIMRERL